MSLWDGLNDAAVVAFGESVTYRKIGHSDESCTGIWTDDIPESSQPGVLSRVDIRMSELSVTPGAGDVIVRDSITYRVVDPVINQYGLWQLQVRK